ncbi:YfiR family protein, partial [candidate division CSSED10-310 bacterium]
MKIKNIAQRQHVYSIMVIMIILLGYASVFSQVNEYMIKAVAIEQVSRFLEWPPDAETEPSPHFFIIALYGENPFGSILEEIYATRKIKERKVKIQYVSKPEDIENCQVLFIPR